MDSTIHVYNTLSRSKEKFAPLNPPFVGMYVCGPTVYGEAHLGNARPAITFDIVYRYLLHKGYKVRYVRNITDVGHLERDSDDGEDKIAKKAKLEQLEPMELVQRYTYSYREVMKKLNVLPPSIEPTATGHIVEQIEMIKKIVDNGYGYLSNGSVYFDVQRYAQEHPYGELSGRVADELISGTRDLDGQQEKKNSADFALWKKASPEHIMRWTSPWSDGFPGWHLECSAMSSKYLGQTFDIHGGGMDLMFPHHESEIAQSKACNHTAPAKYWLHNNMITINGQKMAKSLGNFITVNQLLSGDHELLERSYSPMSVRFFMLQAQYRSTLDFSNESLKAATKAYKRVINGLKIIRATEYTPNTEIALNEKVREEIKKNIDGAYAALDDDFNTAICIAKLFDLLKRINTIQLGQLKTAELGEDIFQMLKSQYVTLVVDILGLEEETPTYIIPLVDAMIAEYKQAKAEKNYAKVDIIRAQFASLGLALRDMTTGVTWAYDEN